MANKKEKIQKAEEIKKTEEIDNKEIKLEQPESQTKSRNNYQLYWIIGAMVFLLAVFFGSYYFFSNLNNFEYNGLTFSKEKFGDIPIFHHYYNFNSGGKLFQYNLNLRNDPRKNIVPITGNAVDGSIELRQENFIYLSVDPIGLTQCEYSRVGIGNLASFLTDNQLSVVGASPNETIAEETKTIHATCDIHPHEDDIIIMIQPADKTEIVHDRKDCYVINIANCEVLQAIEKFEVQAILDAKARRAANSQNSNSKDKEIPLIKPI